MPVNVRGYLTYKDMIGVQSIPVPDGEILTVLDVLNQLAEHLGEEFSDSVFDHQTQALGEHVAVIINGRSYHNLPKNLNTPLQDGDEVAIFPPLAGG